MKLPGMIPPVNMRAAFRRWRHGRRAALVLANPWRALTRRNGDRNEGEPDYLLAPIIEDFEWEGNYVFGPGDPVEYRELRLTRPSYKDRFELLEIEKEVDSEWMMFRYEGLGARVRRKSDRKEFRLGLSELRAVGKDSPNKRLLDDYSIWFFNSR